MINVNFGAARQWALRLPTIYRYMKTQYIEDFFETGMLMLSSYDNCKKHDDVRKDDREGSCNFHIEHDNFSYSGIQSVGASSFILCASVKKADDLMCRFSVDNYLIIDDALGFVDAVSRSVPGFLEGKLGPCSYRDGRSVTKNSEKSLQLDPSAFIDASSYEDTEKAFYGIQHEMANRVDRELLDEVFFIKDLSFSIEDEFRMVWRTSRQVMDSMKFDCRDAVQFCRTGRPLSRDVAKIEPYGDQKISLITGFTRPRE